MRARGTVLYLNVPGSGERGWTTGLHKAKWTAINILYPEFISFKAVRDLRLALQELREFDEELRSRWPPITWTIISHDFGFKWEWGWVWRWKIEYPRRARLLYRLLGLKPPRHDDSRPEEDGGTVVPTPRSWEDSSDRHADALGDAEEVPEATAPPGGRILARLDAQALPTSDEQGQGPESEQNSGRLSLPILWRSEQVLIFLGLGGLHYIQ